MAIFKKLSIKSRKGSSSGYKTTYKKDPVSGINKPVSATKKAKKLNPNANKKPSPRKLGRRHKPD